MYLKSLVLKGFKSFADRSVLSMEPGITAIVGPNGSGKSNISDAVLWVLGERNAKNLRGQVMEDVIFAGSSARKSVGVAEVTLVLDNSDGSLPVDFREVAITRRMYRNGESDYLINNTIARRLDVLDILHDSGLGTGTHSIISQGHLDGILASRPEDRRALIEEAAGVLKHKQRKAKSQRKLEQMDQHLARVNDVVSEVERQLGPLQRKARRALQYEEVSVQLKDLRLALAVDDLRALQREWDASVQRESEELAAYNKLKDAVTSAQSEYERVQSSIRMESSDVAAKALNQSKASSLVERLESTKRIVLEKRRAAEVRSAEVSAALEVASEKRSLATSQKEEALSRLASVTERCEEASQQEAQRKTAFDDARKERMVAEDELSRASRKRNEAQRSIDQARRELSQLQEMLAGALGRVQAAEGLDREFAERVTDAERTFEQAQVALQEAEKQVTSRELDAQSLREKMSQMFASRDAALTELNSAQAAVRSLESQILGLEEVERTAVEAASPVRKWLLERTDERTGPLQPFMDQLSVKQGFESLVESVLGQDALALLASDSKRAQDIATMIKSGAPGGAISLLLGEDANRLDGPSAFDVFGDEALSAKVISTNDFSKITNALLGDVVICETLEDALCRHASDTWGLRYVSKDGSMVYPSGKVVISGNVTSADEGSLARSGHIARLRGEKASASELVALKTSAYEELVESARLAQDAYLAASQKLADAKGALTSAQRESAFAQQRVSKAKNEQKSSSQLQIDAQNVVDSTRPRVEATTLKLQDLESSLSEYRDEVRGIQQKLDPARRLESQASQAYSEAKLKAATLSQQLAYERHVVEERSVELIRLSEEDERSLSVLTQKQAARKRTEPLLDVLDTLIVGSNAILARLNVEVEKAQAASVAAHAQASSAREALSLAREAQSAKDVALSALREEKVRLEMRVQASVNGVVNELGTPLELALELPILEDRASCEEEALRLSRRIANMGVINPDAAREYEELKARYDYLKAQLSDLAAARSTLRKINAIIDERMKDDFAQTFSEVNRHFQEIFTELFPGGSAKLSLCNPDDMETTGVEVEAQPRGKRITKMSLMSGGEKSLVALALLFAVYRTRSTPFYILDEVEAALDDTNLRRLTTYLQKLRNNTQLIMITHQRRTMEMADVLFGVSMQADGVTQVLSQRLEKALQYAE